MNIFSIGRANTVRGDFSRIFSPARRASRLCLSASLALIAVAAGGAYAQSGICGRTAQIQTAILAELASGKTCGAVTSADLAGITGTLTLQNKSISALKADDFAGLAALSRLYLDFNAITTLPVNAFADLDALGDLQLNNNALTALPENVFADLTKLRTLTLHNNALTALPANAFSDLGEVSILWLNNNNFTTVPANVFSSMAKLKTLQLNNNDLATLPENAFSGLAKLETLQLHSNDLATLPANVFSGLAALRKLYLDSNDLATLPANVFAGLAKLDELRLASNSLTTVPANVFADLAELDELRLNGNSLLTTLPANAFSGLVELDTLLLDGNALTTLPANVFADLAELDTLELFDNPLATLPAGAFSGLSPDTVSISGIANLPAPPSAVRLASQMSQDRALRAEWDAVTVAGGAHYQLRWKPAAATTFPPENAAAVTGVTYTIAGLVDGSYEVSVAAVPSAPQQTSAFDQVAWRSTKAQINHRTGLPTRPQQLRLVAGNARLDIDWEAPASDGGSPVTTYHVRWKPLAVAGYSTATTPAATASYAIESLTSGTTYEVQVAAANTIGISDYTDAMQGAPHTVPGAPRNVAVEAGNIRAVITITWDAPDSTGGAPVTGYRYRWSDDGDDGNWESADGAAGVAIAGGASARTSAIETGLSSGTTYSVQVAAVNVVGTGAWSAAESGTPYAFDMDVNTDGAATPADGILVARYLLGVTAGPGLVEGQADTNESVAVAASIKSGVDGKALDVDGDGDVDFVDGQLVLRYLLGLRDDSLVAPFDVKAATVSANMEKLLVQPQ